MVLTRIWLEEQVQKYIKEKEENQTKGNKEYADIALGKVVAYREVLQQQSIAPVKGEPKEKKKLDVDSTFAKISKFYVDKGYPVEQANEIAKTEVSKQILENSMK